MITHVSYFATVKEKEQENKGRGFTGSSSQQHRIKKQDNSVSLCQVFLLVHSADTGRLGPELLE